MLSAAMGSPDPFDRQLNGLGVGVSSLSKICVIDQSQRDDADIDYTFIQLGIKSGELDMAGNCGNMSSPVGSFALNEGLLQKTEQCLTGQAERRRHECAYSIPIPKRSFIQSSNP